jgi:hypothetical protein
VYIAVVLRAVNLCRIIGSCTGNACLWIPPQLIAAIEDGTIERSELASANATLFTSYNFATTATDMFVGFPVDPTPLTQSRTDALRRANAVDAVLIAFSFVIIRVDGLPSAADNHYVRVQWKRGDVSTGSSATVMCSNGTAQWTSPNAIEHSTTVFHFTCILEKTALSEAGFLKGKSVVLSVRTEATNTGEKVLQLGKATGMLCHHALPSSSQCFVAF